MAPFTIINDRVVPWDPAAVGAAELTRVVVAAKFRYRSLDFAASVSDTRGRVVARAALGSLPEPSGIAGADIGDASPTVLWGDGDTRRITGPLTADRTVTLGTAAALNGKLPHHGSVWRFQRVDASAHSLSFVNGGPAGGVLNVFGSGQTGIADFALAAPGDWVEFLLLACSLVDLPSGVGLGSWAVTGGVGSLVSETRTVYGLGRAA